MPTQTKENYLKALYHLQNRDDKISITELSNALEVSKPSANNMVKKLEEKQWVIYEKYQPIQLTEKGIQQARKVIRKHRLAEMFLTQMMGFGWEEVHEIAEEIEHVDSEEFFDKMDQLLGFPEVDPHGSPIPRKDGSIKARNLQQLSTIEEGQTVMIEALTNSSKAFLQFLSKREIALGKELTVLQVEAFDQSREVKIDQKHQVLSQAVCENLLVSLVSK